MNGVGPPRIGRRPFESTASRRTARRAPARATRLGQEERRVVVRDDDGGIAGERVEEPPSLATRRSTCGT